MALPLGRVLRGFGLVGVGIGILEHILDNRPYRMAGPWQLVYDCSSFGSLYVGPINCQGFYTSAASGSTSCAGNQAGSNHVPLGSHVPGWVHRFCMGEAQGTAMRTKRWWRREPGPVYETAAPPQLTPNGVRWPRYGQSPYTYPPTIDPFSAPVSAPEPHPYPIPYRQLPARRPHPGRSPHEQPQWGPGWNISPPRTVPVAPKPPQSVIIQPGRPPVVRPEPVAPPRPQPPGAGTKERKIDLKVRGVAARIIGAATESLDFINALWDALPNQYRSGYYRIHDRNGRPIYVRRWRASQAQRMRDVYRHLDKIDLAKAFQNVVKEQAEDRIWGNLGRWASRAGARGGLGRGLQFGPWDTAFPAR